MNKIAMTLIFGFALNALAVEKRKFDFVVGVDGDFKAAVAAAAAANPSESRRFVIFFPEGEYDLTNLTADRHGKTTFSTSYVSLIGETRDKAVIANKTDTESIGHTATLYFPKNNGMYLQDLTIQNKSTFCGSSACRQVTVQQGGGDKYIFKNVRLISGQDTYYTKGSRTYWEGGEIQGTVDFICGGGDVFFEGTNLVMKREGGYIAVSQNPGDWGYVFNNATINVSNGSYNGNFYLGRSWGHAKTVYMNTIMYAQPKAEGWGPDMNSAPAIYGEYNSKNGNGGAIDVSRRATYFNGGKDPSTATTLKTVWNAGDVAKYTLANIMGGSDNWAPNQLTMQMDAPKISQEGAEILWADNENARCWAVFVNGKFKTSVATNGVSIEGMAPGSKVTVRAANSMGGLGATSNEITVVESNVTYFNVKLNNGIGGTIESNLGSSKVAEGKTATFTAVPAEGWTFAGWTGATAGAANASIDSETLSIVAAGDIELGATFTAKGKTTFQAESGTLQNAINESTNAGFAGSGYVNFGAGDSYVNVPVYVEAAGTYSMEMFYANGSSASRDLIVKSLGSEGAAGGSSKDSSTEGAEQQITFEKTDAWTTYLSKVTEIDLPRGASYIQFAVVGNNDGPNLDQIILTPLKVESLLNQDMPQTFSNRVVNIQLFSMQGKLLRVFRNCTLETENMEMFTRSLPAGTYLIRSTAPGYRMQKVMHVQ